MMRAIVMEADGKRAVLLKENGEFVNVADKGYTAGEHVNTAPAIPYNRIASFAACFLFAVTTAVTAAIGHSLYYTPASYVYMEINPSIRLELNCFDVVINAVPLNGDAEKLLSDYTFKAEKAEKCIDKIVTACKEKQYLNESNNDIKIDLATNDKDLGEKISHVSEKLKEGNLKVEVERVNEEINTEALAKKTTPTRLMKKAEAEEDVESKEGAEVIEALSEGADTEDKATYKETAKAKNKASAAEKVLEVSKNKKDKESTFGQYKKDKAEESDFYEADGGTDEAALKEENSINTSAEASAVTSQKHDAATDPDVFDVPDSSKKHDAPDNAPDTSGKGHVKENKKDIEETFEKEAEEKLPAAKENHGNDTGALDLKETENDSEPDKAELLPNGGKPDEKDVIEKDKHEIKKEPKEEAREEKEDRPAEDVAQGAPADSAKPDISADANDKKTEAAAPSGEKPKGNGRPVGDSGAESSIKAPATDLPSLSSESPKKSVTVRLKK